MTLVSNRVGPPVRGPDFYGRDDFVRLVSDKLKAGHVLLAAPRRFGKTSVMLRLIDEPLWAYHVVHADLEDLSEPAALVTKLIEKLARDGKLRKILQGLSCLSKDLWSRVIRNIDEVELAELKIKLKHDLRPRWQEAGEELFRKVGKWPSTIVFFLDEFPMMIDRMARSAEHREEAKDLLRWLRALRQHPENGNVRFLIAGSIGIDRVLNELGEIATINDFEQVRLHPFAPTVARAFLDELASSHQLDLPGNTKTKMLHLIGTPVPYFIQILFSELSKAHSQDDAPLTPRAVERIYQERVLGVDCKTYFDHYYGRLRDYYGPEEEQAAKNILRSLALQGSLKRGACYQLYKEAIGGAAEMDGFGRLMTDLENDFYIACDATLSFSFACKLLRDWWLRHYGMELDNEG